MKLGIVGLPNVGKSTLFNAITSAGAESANYPFCTIEPNVGVVNVPDQRLEFLEQFYKAKSKVYTSIEFFDIAGLVKGASKGEGLGNKFLANIRQVEAIVHVVRCFEDENVAHVSGEVDPVSDVQTINLELMLADQQFLSRQIEKATKQLKADKSVAARLELLEKIFAQLDQEKAIRDLELTDDEKAIVKSLNLLSAKPVLYVANVGEEDVVDGNDYVQKLKGLVGDDQVLLISASIENEIAQLEPEEKKEFLQDLGLSRSGLDKIVLRSYKLLNLVSFLTAGEKEVRAWTIKKGTLAPEAAGKIHSDIQRGFIRAETISFDEFKKCGSLAIAKSKGLLRLEGKEYPLKDGDIVNFRFNV